MHQLSTIELLPPEKEYLGVVGFPIKHSLSPVFQNAALREMAKGNPSFESWEYLRIEATTEELPELLKICRDRGFRGLNLTLPHKVEVLELLDEIDPVAAKMGAVNTVSFQNHKTIGYNTDGYGLSKGIETTLGMSLKDRPILLMGAGGAARAACVQCLEEGCSHLWIGNRSKDRLDALLEDLQASYSPDRMEGFLTGDELPDVPGDTLLIQSTSLGLKPEDPLPVTEELLAKIEGLYDLVYGKDPTRLVRKARSMGKLAADGLTMLVHQGAKSLSIWTGEEVPVDAMLDAVKLKL